MASITSSQRVKELRFGTDQLDGFLFLEPIALFDQLVHELVQSPLDRTNA